MQPVEMPTKKLAPDVNCPEAFNETSNSGGEVMGACLPTTYRGTPRNNVHPAYAPLDRTELDARANDPEAFNLQVQIRTRESGYRSPLVSTPTHRHLWSTSSPSHWNQHSSGTNTPRVATPICSKKEFPSLTGYADITNDPLPSEVVHRALHGKCRFISFPLLPPFDPLPPPPGSNYPLFVGQVRFEITPAELVWLFRRTSGASPLTIEGRGSGCFILYLKSEAERSLVRQLHKRILFDIGGVWFARTSEEVDSLCEHVALDGPYLSKKARLPRDAMVIEDLKVDSSDTPPCYPLYYSRGSSQQRYSAERCRWGGASSTRSTPTLASLESRPPSPTFAPFPPLQYQTLSHDVGHSTNAPYDMQ